MSPLFQLGRDCDNGGGSYDDDLDEYDDNWDLRDIPLEPRGSSAAREQQPHEKETELTSRGGRTRQQRSLHHDEEEAVLCPLVFREDDDYYDDVRHCGGIASRRSSRSSWWASTAAAGGRRRSPIKSTVIFGTAACVVIVFAMMAWFPSISRHATSFKSSILLDDKSRQLIVSSPRTGQAPDDPADFLVIFPSSAPSKLRRKDLTTLDPFF
jgi:hypothetical protein